MCCLVFSPDALKLCVPPDHRAKIWPQMFTNLWLRAALSPNCLSFPFLSNHYFRLLFPTLLVRADHTKRVDSFVQSVCNGSTVQTNLQVTICRFSTRLRSISTKRPCDQHSNYADWLGFETSLSRASLLDARSSRSPPAAAGMAARFSNNLQSLTPALRFHLQASSKRTYAYTTRSHRTPPVGVQSQGTHNDKFTRTDATMQALVSRRERTTMNQGGYNI